jgi:hypothetical protein
MHVWTVMLPRGHPTKQQLSVVSINRGHMLESGANEVQFAHRATVQW